MLAVEKRYFITTFGCQLNVHESEKLAGMLEELGYIEGNDISSADVIVFNTCAIREGAQDRAIGNIGSLKKIKRKHPEKIVAVCGCMTQQLSESQWLKNTFPFVDIIFGTSNLYEFKDFLQRRLAGEKRILEYGEDFNLQGENVALKRTSGNNAWINIMQGCNNFCTYCIVPYVRGRERSRSSDEILEEIKEVLKDPKYTSVTLLGQNVNSYGQDRDEISFAELLRKICALKGDFKVGFMTSHPKDLTSEVIDVIANEDKMKKEIHLPVQSGSNKILAKMNRKYTRESYLKIVKEIREKIPDCRITTDIIVGFPGESEEDFEETVSLLKEVEFDDIFAFMYSKRKGTVAEKMEGQVPEEIKNKRVNICLSLQKEIKKGKLEDR